MPKQYSLQLINVDTQKVLKTFDLSKAGKYIIGRSEKADITVQHESLSRKHAEILVTPKLINIKDLDSVNGTYINEKKLNPNQVVVLKHKIGIYLGECQNKLVVIEQTVESDSSDDEDSDNNEIVKKSKKNKKEQKKAKKSKSRSRSRSTEQEKKEKNQAKITPASNKQFGKEKANLTSVFGKQSKNIEDKRKLLWGNKDKKEIPKEKQIWNNLSTNESGTGDKLKFMKLLGVKNVDEYQKSKSDNNDGKLIMKSAANVAVNKNDVINDQLEKQFYQGMSRKFMGKGGLGN